MRHAHTFILFLFFLKTETCHSHIVYLHMTAIISGEPPAGCWWSMFIPLLEKMKAFCYSSSWTSKFHCNGSICLLHRDKSNAAKIMKACSRLCWGVMKSDKMKCLDFRSSWDKKKTMEGWKERCLYVAFMCHIQVLLLKVERLFFVLKKLQHSEDSRRSENKVQMKIIKNRNNGICNIYLNQLDWNRSSYFPCQWCY